jgi:phosphocarrier protein
MITANVTIVNKLGLHARAASRLVNTASGFAADIEIVRGARSVNAKSIMGVLTLAAALGAELVIQADGPDDQQAVDALTTLFRDRFGEDE